MAEQLPHDPYITAVTAALATHNITPATCWTNTNDGQLIAVFRDWPAGIVDQDTWPADVYLTWDQHAGWQLIDLGDSRTTYPLDPAGVTTYSSPRQVACSVDNALRGHLVTGPIATAGPGWDSRAVEAAVTEWEAASEAQQDDGPRATLARVRDVLETEAVVGRSALEYRGLITAALLADEAVATVDRAAECSAQHHEFDDGRFCIRAAQHSGDHIDERGYHWSDTARP